MISNLAELVLYTESIASQFPAIASEIELCSPGYSDEQLVELVREVPDLPPDYLDIAKKVKLAGVSIGLFSLWPVPYGKKNFPISLTEANKSSKNPFLAFYNSNDFVEVARLESNIICLGRATTKNEGQVFFVDISSGPNPVIYKLADNFEQLLILAGNLHDVSMTYENNLESGVRELTFRLNKLGLDSDSASIWNDFLQEALF